MFAREAKENATIKSAMQEFVFFGVDCEKGEGPAIAKKYGIHAYPTFIAMNGKGEVTDRWVGYGGAEAWSHDALAASADPRTILAKKAAFDAGPTAKLAVCLANDAAGSSNYTGAVDYLRTARELDQAGAAEYTDQILMNMFYGARGGAFTFDEVDAEAQQALADFEVTVEQQIDMAMMMRALARQTEQPQRAVPYLKAAMAASEGSTDEGVMASRTELEVDYALFVEKDAKKALKIYRTTFDEGWQDDPGKLNQFAWWCFENNVNLAEAQELALKGAELADNDATRANILDTAAEICNKLGNCDEAVASMKRAIALDPNRQYFKDQLVKFEKALAEKDQG